MEWAWDLKNQEFVSLIRFFSVKIQNCLSWTFKIWFFSKWKLYRNIEGETAPHAPSNDVPSSLSNWVFELDENDYDEKFNQKIFAYTKITIVDWSFFKVFKMWFDCDWMWFMSTMILKNYRSILWVKMCVFFFRLQIRRIIGFHIWCIFNLVFFRLLRSRTFNWDKWRCNFCQLPYRIRG